MTLDECKRSTNLYHYGRTQIVPDAQIRKISQSLGAITFSLFTTVTIHASTERRVICMCMRQ